MKTCLREGLKHQGFYCPHCITHRKSLSAPFLPVLGFGARASRLQLAGRKGCVRVRSHTPGISSSFAFKPFVRNPLLPIFDMEASPLLRSALPREHFFQTAVQSLAALWKLPVATCWRACGTAAPSLPPRCLPPAGGTMGDSNCDWIYWSLSS